MTTAKKICLLKYSTLIPAENHALRLGGAVSHPSRFTICYKLSQCTMMFQWRQLDDYLQQAEMIACGPQTGLPPALGQQCLQLRSKAPHSPQKLPTVNSVGGALLPPSLLTCRTVSQKDIEADHQSFAAASLNSTREFLPPQPPSLQHPWPADTCQLP